MKRHTPTARELSDQRRKAAAPKGAAPTVRRLADLNSGIDRLASLLAKIDAKLATIAGKRGMADDVETESETDESPLDSTGAPLTLEKAHAVHNARATKRANAEKTIAHHGIRPETIAKVQARERAEREERERRRGGR